MNTRALPYLSTLTLLAALSASAQAPPAAQPMMPGAMGAAPSAASDADASRLPGDRAPPRGMMMPPPGGGAPGGAPGGASGGTPGGRPPPEPGSDAPSPSLALAIEAAQAAVDACKADGYNIGVAVIDSSGQPRASLAGDGSTGGHIYTAVRKGLAAVAFKMPTSKVGLLIATDKAAAARVTPAMLTWGGAVPLMAGDKLLGAIGASGASSQQDEKCAQAGAAKVMSRLK